MQRRGWGISLIGAALLSLLTFGALPAMAGDASVAVAANFTAPAKEIAALYKARTGYTIDLSFGASGQFYTQISQGAPFDIFLSADDERTKKAVQEGFAVQGSEFTYAIGKLALWSAIPGYVDKDGAVLKKGAFQHLSVATPKAAPYGTAAIETLNALGLYKGIEAKIVTGENIGQTYQFILSKNAELGFVAYSQVIGQKEGSLWLVPEKYYSPIVQNAVLLKHGQGNTVAKGFYTFLKSKAVAEIIQRYGYALKGGK